MINGNKIYVRKAPSPAHRAQTCTSLGDVASTTSESSFPTVPLLSQPHSGVRGRSRHDMKERLNHTKHQPRLLQGELLVLLFQNQKQYSGNNRFNLIHVHALSSSFPPQKCSLSIHAVIHKSYFAEGH